MKGKVIKINGLWLFIPLLIWVIIKTFINSDLHIEIFDKDFEKILLNNGASKIICVRNTKTVYVEPTAEYLLKLIQESSEKENIKKHKKNILQTIKHNFFKMFNVKKNVIFFMIIPSIKVFNDNFKEIQAKLTEDKRIGYAVREDTYWFNTIGKVAYFLFTLLFIYYILVSIGLMKGGKSGIGGIFGFGKSKAKLFDRNSKNKIMFKDVAGMQEVKQELQEIVDYLKNKYGIVKLGGKIPKGVLLIGPPGNGKTLLAKAVAGEAEVPFFSLSGSDFSEMFYGVGSARVRSLFEEAKSVAPAIVFIDEIDSIGKKRGRRYSTNDDQENTLNTLLTEMDGFADNSGVIIMAATNRVEMLDEALLRPGRFDRQVQIDKPTIKDREAIFTLYIKKIKTDESVDIKRLSEQTAEFSAAEIANVCNEAALLAVRNKHEKVTWSDFQEAMDRTIGGIEKRSRIVPEEERKIIAYHEAGHAVVSWFLKYAHPLLKVTIISRGEALGYAQYTPKEQFIRKKEEMIDELCSYLGGRISEEIFFETQSSGAVNDLENVCKIAYNIVTVYGMNDKIGSISFNRYFNQREMYEGKPYSEDTAKLIDNEVRSLVDMCYKRTQKLLENKKEQVKNLAEELLVKEVIYKEDVEKIIGAREFAQE